jgi:hypothetical protein
MINELIAFKRNILAWGLEVPKAYHPKINGNSVNGTGYIVRISRDGITKIEPFEDYSKLFFYKQSNHKSSPSFKFSNDPSEMNNLLDACERNLKYAAELNLLIADEDPLLKQFGRLADFASQIDHIEFTNAVVMHLREVNKVGPVYLCLDLEGPDRIIQTIDFFNALNKKLVELDSKVGDELDVLGNPLTGYDTPFPDIKIGSPIGTFPVYCRNKANRCYRRYGLNSFNACRIGAKSRAELSDLVQYILQGSRQATDEQSGIWYQFTICKPKDEGKREYLVLTSISPNNNLLEIGNIKAEDWEGDLMDVVDSLRRPSRLPDINCGQVIVIRKLKGSWKVVASQQRTLNQVADHVQRWIDGANNGNIRFPKKKMFPPSIFSFTNQMNKIWKVSGTEMDFERTKTFDIQDTYDFFFDDQYVIEKAARLFANRLVPMLLDSMGLDDAPFDVCLLGTMQNLILHKLGHIYNQEELCMDHWAFYMGALFREANYLYRQFFEKRGSNVPNVLIGQKFIIQAYTNPRNAYHGFIAAFAACENWCEQNGAFTLRFRELATKLAEATQSELPAIPNFTERMMLSAGYLNYHKKPREVSEEPQAEQVQQPVA